MVFFSNQKRTRKFERDSLHLSFSEHTCGCFVIKDFSCSKKNSSSNKFKKNKSNAFVCWKWLHRKSTDVEARPGNWKKYIYKRLKAVWKRTSITLEREGECVLKQMHVIYELFFLCCSWHSWCCRMYGWFLGKNACLTKALTSFLQRFSSQLYT